jgi:hypothetical protein
MRRGEIRNLSVDPDNYLSDRRARREVKPKGMSSTERKAWRDGTFEQLQRPQGFETSPHRFMQLPGDQLTAVKLEINSLHTETSRDGQVPQPWEARRRQYLLAKFFPEIGGGK